jgi:hypothetical protein
MRSPGADDVTVVRASLVDTDRYGAQQRDWPAAAQTVVTGVSVQYLSPSLETDEARREYASSHLALFAPAGTDLLSTDRVLWRGELFDVDGEPFTWIDDDGEPDHLFAALKRRTG